MVARARGAIIGQHAARLAFQDRGLVQLVLNRQVQQLVVGNAGPQEKRQARGQLRIADSIGLAGRNIGGRRLEAEDEFRVGQDAAQGDFDAGFEASGFVALLLIEA